MCRCEACTDAASCEHCLVPLLLRRFYDSSGDPTNVAGRTHECASACDTAAEEIAYDADDDTVDDACLRCTSVDANCEECSFSAVVPSHGTCDACAAGYYRIEASGVPGVYDGCADCEAYCTTGRGNFYYYDSALDAATQICNDGLAVRCAKQCAFAGVMWVVAVLLLPLSRRRPHEQHGVFTVDRRTCWMCQGKLSMGWYRSGCARRSSSRSPDMVETFIVAN
jgi:hypothetical protein